MSSNNNNGSGEKFATRINEIKQSFEKYYRELGRELQWSICQLHGNECLRSWMEVLGLLDQNLFRGHWDKQSLCQIIT